MTEVQIHTTRLDSRANETLMAIANASAAAFGYTAELSMDGQLAQLLRLRVAQINSCTYCLTVHYRAARDVGVPQTKIELLSAWWETRLFTDAERAALQYAEALTRASDTTVTQAFQQYHDRLTAHFDEAAMLEIVAVWDAAYWAAIPSPVQRRQRVHLVTDEIASKSAATAATTSESSYEGPMVPVERPLQLIAA